jgi:KaiC/GvpD/RAD55 family RecA-like ATPase
VQWQLDEDDPEVKAESAKYREAHGTANGQDHPGGGLHLVPFEAMQPRVSDGYLVKHLLSSAAMAVVYGESGSGKTFFALHVGMRLAAGFEIFGRRVRRAGVVYVAAEAGKSIENRVAAAKLHNSPPLPPSMPFAAITTRINLCTETADTDRLVAAIRGAALEKPVELIIIDTLSRVMAGGNENAPDDMGALVRNIDRLRAETGAAVLLVHHTGKDTSRGARGHSLLHAATDTELETTKDEAVKLYTVQVTKQRELATEGTLTFSLRQVVLGHDQDGDQVTSCILEPVEGVPSPRQKPAKLTGPAKVGFEQLKNCMANHAVDVPASSHVPKGAKGVTLEQWRGFLEKAAVINPKGNPREQFRRIRVTLQDRGFIGVWADFVWLSQSVTTPSRDTL